MDARERAHSALVPLGLGARHRGIAALAKDPSYTANLKEIASLPESEKATKLSSLIAYNAETFAAK